MFFKVRQKIVLVFIFILPVYFCSVDLFSVPAFPGFFEITQPDGAKLTVYLKGDEWFNWIETQERKAIIRNPDTGYYEYAEIKKVEDREILAPSGIIVKDDDSFQSPAYQRIKPVTKEDLGRLWQKAGKGKK